MISTIPAAKNGAGKNVFLGTQTCGAESARKGKGCDIGYALAIGSCEEANSMETCTGVCFPQLSTFVTNCEQRKLSNSIGGGSLYGGRARPYDSGSARRALPNCVALQGRWVNSEGLLKRF
jgi:hypothetical protein